uniref:Uncharacterized protein n=1 Tax=Picea sitchensis TaxID=3332 RepID=D5AA98_PICSI|nr:unknown [Picea sitchensis]
MDGPSGFAAFPPPLARRFFWMIGFRYDKKFYFMVYQGKLLDNIDASSLDSDTKVFQVAEFSEFFRAKFY